MDDYNSNKVLLCEPHMILALRSSDVLLFFLKFLHASKKLSVKETTSAAQNSCEKSCHPKLSKLAFLLIDHEVGRMETSSPTGAL